MLRLPLEGGDIVGLIAKAENASIIFIQTAEKGSVEEKWMITIVVEVFPLKQQRRVMVVKEDGVTWLQNRTGLPWMPDVSKRKAVPAGPRTWTICEGGKDSISLLAQVLGCCLL